jgi:gamma-glutamylputrescine oxidase
MVEVFPQLRDVEISHTWSGRLGLTFNLMPHAGRLKDGPHQGIWYAYGFAGHGVSVGSYMGAELGDVIAGKAEPGVMTQAPQPRFFFTRYDRLYLPVVSQWFRFLDRVA